MQILQQRFLFLKGLEIEAIGPTTRLCEVSASRQLTFSEFVSDIAWLLKKPSENFQQSITAAQIQRFNCLLSFLICNESNIILEKLLEKLNIVISSMEFDSMVNGTYDGDLSLLKKYTDNARDVLYKKYKKSEGSELQSGSELKGYSVSQICSQDNVLSVPVNSQVRTQIFWFWLIVNLFASFYLICFSLSLLCRFYLSMMGTYWVGVNL